jgi:hypothetical protein
MFRKERYTQNLFRIHQARELFVQSGTVQSDGVYENCYIDLQIEEEEAKAYVLEIETKVVQDLFQQHPLVNGITPEGKLRCKFITRYGHFIIQLMDNHGTRVNRYHLQKEDSVCVRISPTHAWHNDQVCGVTWVITSFTRLNN